MYLKTNGKSLDSLKVDFLDYFQNKIRIGRCFARLGIVVLLAVPVRLCAQVRSGQVTSGSENSTFRLVRSESRLVPHELPPDLPISIDSTDVDSVGFYTDTDGTVLGFRAPVRRAELSFSSLMAEEMGVFTHSFGGPGWPGGVSVFGLDPNRISLSLDGIPFDDLLTGRPRYDLLPSGLINEMRLSTDIPGAGAGIHAVSGSFRDRVPVTNMRYRSSHTGLQAVDVVHAQTRSIHVLGQDDWLGVVFGYAGAGASGEYPGSRLRRSRRLLTRLRLERSNWSAELLELYNRRRIGAHGGVLPRSGQGASSIYQRIGATVTDEDSERQIIRNDLSLRIRLQSDEEPLTLTSFWKTQSFQYRLNTDTTTIRLHRFGLIIDRSFKFNSHRIGIAATAWTDRLRSGNALLSGTDKNRKYAELRLNDRFSIGPIALQARLGIHDDDGASFLSASLESSFPLVRHADGHNSRLRITAGRTGLRTSWYDGNGFRPGSLSRMDHTVPVISRVEIQVDHFVGPIGITLQVFAHSVSSTLVWSRDGTNGNTRATRLGSAVRRVGGSLELSYRKNESHGLYALARPSVVHSSTGDQTAIGSALVKALPGAWLYARLGIRKLLFKGDMDLDLSARVRYWDAMGGRRLDPSTGLLVLPSNDSRTVKSSATVDIVAEAGVLSATLFVSYENLFSGTNLLRGNLLVPDYPLPSQRFRFGVYWPIRN